MEMVLAMELNASPKIPNATEQMLEHCGLGTLCRIKAMRELGRSLYFELSGKEPPDEWADACEKYAGLLAGYWNARNVIAFELARARALRAATEHLDARPVPPKVKTVIGLITTKYRKAWAGIENPTLDLA